MGFQSLRANLKNKKAQRVAVAWALDDSVLNACGEGIKQGFLSEVILTGPEEKITEIIDNEDLDQANFKIINATTPEEGAFLAVQSIRNNEADLLMKGSLNTSVILRAVLNKETGIRAQALLSHIAIIELPSKRLALLTDAGMNIKPDLTQKFQILDNAIQFAWSIGLENPKVAALASIETINPQMQDTLDAAALTQMARRKQFKMPAIIDGPLAFDNTYSKEAALQKGIESEVAGDADIFFVPEITTGNVLYKSLTYVAKLKTAGIVYGASCPIILTSRADNFESKLNAIAVACQALTF